MIRDTAYKTKDDNVNRLKRIAAEFAVKFIQDGMTVGLGTGSTAEYAIREIAKKIGDGSLKGLTFIPTSLRTESLAKSLGMNVIPIEELISVDVTIDGADEVDPELNLIKGGGGALLREKIVAQNSDRNIVIVDESKLSNKLGDSFLLPVEVYQFAHGVISAFLQSLGAEISLRLNTDGSVYMTDQQNYIIDCNFGAIKDPELLSGKLDSRAGIAEHGLFLGTTSDLIVGSKKGCRHIQR